MYHNSNDSINSYYETNSKRNYLFLLLVLVLICFSSTFVASKETIDYLYIFNDDFVNFSSETSCCVRKSFNEIPNTIEITLSINDHKERVGTIFGNFYDSMTSCINYEIMNNGIPRLYLINSDRIVTDIWFDNINIPVNKKVHLTFSYDKVKSKFSCYIDGVLKQVMPYDAINSFNGNLYSIGRDFREDNENYFKGKLYNITIYEMTQSQNQIKSEILGLPSFTNVSLSVDFPLLNSCCDITGNQEIYYNDYDWCDFKDPCLFDYSMVAIGDIQTLNHRFPNKVASIFDYLISNKEKYNIKFCFGLGDVTENNSDREWGNFINNIIKLNEKIPYCINYGNHDSSSSLNSFFENNKFVREVYSGYFSEPLIDNAYSKIQINNDKYIIFCLEYGCSNEVINWADKVISNNLDYKVIITTHSYLYKDGTTLDKYDLCPPSLCGLNDGDDVWKKLIKRHSNIKIVVCGHDPCDNIIVSNSVGDNGNVVKQILINPQNIEKREPLGMVCFLFFSNDSDEITIRYYSTVKQKYYRDVNQIII